MRRTQTGMTTEPNRVDAGVPTGGQFATKIKSDDVPSLGVTTRRPELAGWPESLPEPELEVSVGEGGTISTSVKVNGEEVFDIWNPADDIHDTESDDFVTDAIPADVHDAAKAWAFEKHNEIAWAIRHEQQAAFERSRADILAKATGARAAASDEELAGLIEDSGSVARQALKTTELASAALAARKIKDVHPEAVFADLTTDSWDNGEFISGVVVKNADRIPVAAYAEGEEGAGGDIVALLKNLDADANNAHWSGELSTGTYGDELYEIDLEKAAAWRERSEAEQPVAAPAGVRPCSNGPWCTAPRGSHVEDCEMGSF